MAPLLRKPFRKETANFLPFFAPMDPWPLLVLCHPPPRMRPRVAGADRQASISPTAPSSSEP